MASEGAHLYSVVKATRLSEGLSIKIKLVLRELMMLRFLFCRDIRRYQRAFQNIVLEGKDHTISEKQFIELLTSTEPGEAKGSPGSKRQNSIPVELGRALFAAADRDKNGGIDFRELMVSLSLLASGPGSSVERMRHLIAAFDTNGSSVQFE